MAEITTLCSGRFLSLASIGGWEFATRTNTSAVVAIIALTPDDEMILVEQFRPPVGGPVIEVPAVPPALGFILSAMAGHLFGYEAALAIDASANPLRRAREAIDAKLKPLMAP